MAHSCASQTDVCVAAMTMPRTGSGHDAAALAKVVSPSATSLRDETSVRGVTPASTRADSGGASGRSCCSVPASPSALPSSMVTCGCGTISDVVVGASAGTAAACSAAAASARRCSRRMRFVVRPPGFEPS